MQESDWNCGSDLFFNHKKKPFDDPRVRRALALAIDRWGGAPALSKIAIVKTVGGIVFPESPLAATKEELQKIAGFWPDIEKSRAEAKRLLKEAGAENLTFELLNRDVDQPYKYVGIWLVDQWSKIGVKVTQKVVPTGPWFQAMRSGQFSVVHYPICRSVVNPVLDVQPYLPVSDENYGDYEDDKEMELYNKVLHETDPTEAAGADDRVPEIRDGRPGARDLKSCGGTASCRTAPTSKAGRSARAISSTRISRRSGSTSSCSRACAAVIGDGLARRRPASVAIARQPGGSANFAH